MKLSIVATLSLVAFSTALPSLEIERSASLNSTVLACDALQLAYKSQVFFPGSANYTAENERESSSLERCTAVANIQLQISGRLQTTFPQLVSSRRNLHKMSRSLSSHLRVSMPHSQFVEGVICPFRVMRIQSVEY